MNKRLFTFGCSFTKWSWPTWNDYIGLSFDEYYNFALGGADNKNILYKFLQADKKYKFTIYEHPDFFTKYNFNKKKLVIHRASMKYYFDYLN